MDSALGREYTPNESVVPFHESTARVKALMGPVGSGKSLAWMMHFCYRAVHSPVSLRGVVFRQSWPELRDSTKVTWDRWLEGVSDWRAQPKQMVVTLQGVDGHVRQHTMDFRHARNAADATRLLSTEYGMIILEECVPAFDVARAVIGGGHPKEIFLAAVPRLRQEGVASPEILCIFNPPSKRHWTYQEFIGPSETEHGCELLRQKGYDVFRQPAFENQKNLRPGYYEELLRILSPELAKRFVHGLPITVYPGAPVYPTIIEDVHIVPHVELLPDLPINTCHDFGRTPAVVFYQVTKEGQFRVPRELQFWGVSTETMSERMQAFMDDEMAGMRWGRGFGDPAGQNPTETDDKTSFSIMAAKGFPLMAGAETLAARLEAVKQRAARMAGREPALLISSDGAPQLTDALLGGYRYPKSGDGQIGFAPLKNDFSHIANAFEYGVSGEFSPYTGARLRPDEVRKREGLIPKYSPLDSTPSGGGGSWKTW